MFWERMNESIHANSFHIMCRINCVVQCALHAREWVRKPVTLTSHHGSRAPKLTCDQLLLLQVTRWLVKAAAVFRAFPTTCECPHTSSDMRSAGTVPSDDWREQLLLQATVTSSVCHQLLVRPLLHHDPVLQEDDVIRLLHGLQLMRHQQDRPSSGPNRPQHLRHRISSTATPLLNRPLWPLTFALSSTVCACWEECGQTGWTTTPAGWGMRVCVCACVCMRSGSKKKI